MPSNVLCMQTLYQLLQPGISPKSVAMASTVIDVYKCAIRAQ